MGLLVWKNSKSIEPLVKVVILVKMGIQFFDEPRKTLDFRLRGNDGYRRLKGFAGISTLGEWGGFGETFFDSLIVMLTLRLIKGIMISFSQLSALASRAASLRSYWKINEEQYLKQFFHGGDPPMIT